MLETIRELASERLEASGEEPAIRDAHARAYLAMAEVGGPNRRGAVRAAWLDTVESERENMRAALAWTGMGGDAETGLRLAAGLAPFWLDHGLIDEGKRALAALLTVASEPSLGRARALAVAGVLQVLDADLEGAERVCRESLALLPAGEDWYRAVSLNVLGTTARSCGRLADARRRYDEAISLVTSADLWWPAALAQANLGLLAGLEELHAEALERHERAVAIFREGGDAWMVATTLMNAGRAARRLGDLDRAGSHQAEALRGFVARENPWGIATCLDACAGIAVDLGRHVQAGHLFGAAEAMRERLRLALWHATRDEHEAGMRATASALGEEAWARALANGRMLTQSEAIAEAHASIALQRRIATG
jgi:tetratricopeptide (TPR) repeat protein